MDTRPRVLDGWCRRLDRVSGTRDVHRHAVVLCIRTACLFAIIQSLAVTVSCWTLETELVQEAREMWATACKRTATPFRHRLVDCEAIYARAYDGQSVAWVASRLLPALRTWAADLMWTAASAPLAAAGAVAIAYLAAVAVVFAASAVACTPLLGAVNAVVAGAWRWLVGRLSRAPSARAPRAAVHATIQSEWAGWSELALDEAPDRHKAKSL